MNNSSKKFCAFLGCDVLDAVLVAKYVFSCYNITIAVLGTISNLLIFFICLRKELRKRTTFKLFAFVAITNMFSLYQWNLYQVVLYLFNIDLNLKYLPCCLLISYFQHVTFESSAWFLASTTIDRFLTVKYWAWSNIYFKGRRVTIFGFSLIIFFIAANLPYAIKGGYLEIGNKTAGQPDKVRCYFSAPGDSFLVDAWSWILMVTHTIIPFLLISCFNVLLIYSTRSRNFSNVSRKRKSEQRRMTYSVITITLLFMASTLPTASIQGQTLKFFLTYALGEFWVLFCNFFTFSFQASTFPILYLTNSQIKAEFKKIISRKKVFSETIGTDQTQKG